MENKTINIDHMSVEVEGERNLLELCRKAGIELPTFCYHSDISVYGACRMCMVDVEGRGMVPACSTQPQEGMVINTNTQEIRKLRKMIVELMLASHDQSCTTCPKSGNCRLQTIATQMGVSDVRFKQAIRTKEVDASSDCIQRDPSKCILCGDCVRVCEEIQSVGALGFAYRGAKARVGTPFNKGIGDIECVGCGQCVKSCPVGALTERHHINKVWDALDDDSKTVVVQIAPSVRVALGEHFGKAPGEINTGRIVAGLRRMGFKRVFDTCYGADFTVVEEGKEFLERREKGENLPLFTSCCPAWVKFAEQYYPDFLNNLSTCRSPMQMFGSICKDQMTESGELTREDLIVVAVMPCTAKKFEAERDDFKVDGNPNIDIVITTNELALMMKESGIDFDKLEISSFDSSFSYFTGGAVIFGSSGGVSEAVLRYAADALDKGSAKEYKQLRGFDGIKISEVTIGDETLSLAIVSGLANARKLIDMIRNGEANYDLIEVMACRGGCVNGGGQPITSDRTAVEKRSQGLYDNDRMMQFHVSSENPHLQQLYEDCLTEEKAHELLHTSFETRRRIVQDDFSLFNDGDSETEPEVSLKICFGTSCFLRGAQNLYKGLIDYINENGLESKVEVKANFCGKLCKKGPVLDINGTTIEHCTIDDAKAEIERILQG